MADSFIPDAADTFKADPKPSGAPKITPEDRRAYTEASNDLSRPENVTTQAALEEKYGGRDAFTMALDPVGEVAGRYVLPPVLEAAMAVGGGELLTAVPWIQRGVRAAEPAFTKYAVPTLAKTAGKIGEGIEAAGPAAKRVLTGPMLKKALEALGLGAAGYEATKLMRGKE